MTTTPSNPNTQPYPSTNAEYSDQEKDLLDIAKVEAWRSHQHDILSGLREADPDVMNGAYVNLFNDNVDDALDDYLTQQGINRSSTNYGRVREIYRNASIDKIHDEQWYTSPAARGEDPTDTVSGRDKVISDIAAKTMVDTISPDTEEEGAFESVTGAELLKRARAKHGAYVEKMKGPVFLRPKLRRELQEKYEQAEKDYYQLVDLMSQNDLARWSREGKTQDEIGELLAESVNQRHHNDVEAERQLLVEKSGWLGKQLERYANLSRGKKILVTMGLGAAGLGIGFGAGLLAGAAGAVGAALLASGVTAGSMKALGAARIYKLRQADLFKKQEDLPQFDHNELGDEVNTPTPEGIRRRAVEFLKNQSHAQLERGEKIKKRAVYWTLGTVAVGGAAGALAHGLWAGEGAGAHWPGGQAQHWLEEKWHRPWENSSNHTTYVGSGSASGGDHPGSGNGGDIPGSAEGTHTETHIKHIDIGNTTYVERGSGLIREVKQTVNGAGYKIDGETAEDLYKALRAKFGDDGIINIKGISQDTYTHGNDLRLSAPGNAVWREGVTDYMEKWLEDHGHGVKVTVEVSNSSTSSPVVSEGTASLSEAANRLDGQVAEATQTLGVESNGTANLSSAAEGLGNHVTEAAQASGPEFAGATEALRAGSFTEALDNLNANGVIDVSQDSYPDFVKRIGPHLSTMHYSDGTPIAQYNHVTNQWWLNEAPNGTSWPWDALTFIRSYALAYRIEVA